MLDYFAKRVLAEWTEPKKGDSVTFSPTGRGAKHTGIVKSSRKSYGDVILKVLSNKDGDEYEVLSQNAEVLTESFAPKATDIREIAYSLDDIADEIISLFDRMRSDPNVPKYFYRLLPVIADALSHYAKVLHKEKK
jgi:hypothetical protein